MKEYNNQFKKINTEQKAYFLGFMYADGCLSKIKTKSKYIKPQVQISLADEQIIMDLYKIFSFFNLQVFDFGKYNSNWSKQFALRKANNQLFEDLLSHGLLEKKSGINSELLNIPLLDEYLVSHFIRGIFDGDGSINISAKRPNLRRIEICSSSSTFLSQIKSVLEANQINCPIFREKNNNKSPLYVLEWVNSKDVLTFKDFIYKNATIFLKRKKEMFDSFKIIDKKDKNPLCPDCSNPSVKKGSRQMKHGLVNRYSCIFCGRKFSNQAQVKSDELLENLEIDNQQPS